MRERLKAEAGGAILAWIIEGARLWHANGTAPPADVRDMTAEYLGEQDVIGQWLEERCTRDAGSFELSGALHRNYKAWCEGQGHHPKSNVALSAHLVSAGFLKKATMSGKAFYGLKFKAI
jgi:phage/plasmid-associated DNA primase